MSLRTPLKEVRRLGSAREGADHFWKQRLTGIANLFLGLFLVWLVARLAGADHATVKAMLAKPWVALPLLLLIVSGTILKFERSAVSVRSGDALSPLDLRIHILARIVARERITGKVVLDREVRGQTEVRSSTDLVSAERQAVPLAMQELARSATALLVDGTW